MAGMETLVVHSKSYVVRWLDVPEQQSISWSVEPHKRSINFGIFKHPGTKGGLTPGPPTQEVGDAAEAVPSTAAQSGSEGSTAGKRGRRASVARNEYSQAREKLESIGIKTVAWTGKCDADKLTMGRYDVQAGQGGTYGMVFDNTFSKQTSKTVHIVLMTHPTDAPPKSGHHLHYSQVYAGSGSSVGKGSSPSMLPATDSNESLPQTNRAVLEDPRPSSRRGTETKGTDSSSFYTGTLHKKRRKKAQGFAKRFFSLDFTSSTISYYRDRHSSALRGAVPLSLAAVGVNEKTREFSIDSGAEVWHLKALNRKDFEGWRDALERASAISTTRTPARPAAARNTVSGPNAFNPAEDREWERAEQLVSKVAGTRDAIRGLAKDTDPKYAPGANGSNLRLTPSGGSSNAPSPSSYESASINFPEPEEGQVKRPFWKRQPSAERSPAALFRRTVSAQLAVPSPSSAPLSSAPGSFAIRKRPSFTQTAATLPEEDVHDRCMALLRDLDDVVSDFSELVAESKARRHPPRPTLSSRMSLESVDQEFFDAEDGENGSSQLLTIRQSEDEEEHEEQLFDQADETDSDTSSDAGDATRDSSGITTTTQGARNAHFPAKPTSLAPLPMQQPVKRRTTVTPPKQAPPSIIGFLRKNAGKDLSTVSMPVTANEPTSLVQRFAESLEYPQLLDQAASASTSTQERLMYVTAFAISYFANNRVKERAIRKPFNPMLGETYELVREDLGFRLLAEKVSHHPVRMASQAESLKNGGWSLTQSPQPVQKFWGKSVELNTEGRVRVTLHSTGEHYSWTQATCFLRNVIAGEKYVEPVQSMTVTCETSGAHAVTTFKAGGMFSGRSEEVAVQLFDPQSGDTPLPLGLAGKWTESLKRTDTGATIWTAGSLVADAPKVYGFTAFAAALNEVTEVEDGWLPPTDSRLRPDQKALEMGDVDKAEGLKARLEERQRARRKVLESHGQVWKPHFFDKVESGADEEVWLLKGGGANYWERRAKRDWSDVREVFEL
ncbi:hypothetical protein B0A50_02529 [Salinomyces thailandicus]|uniref:PH domain-containing protein n=1 Tax=Salinomyces thailandicus TaxID=706561 RepID=A0A4V5N728_9PEZI|nr:hypothetical protein B0A50_02529 [Salinomyces thailandica]